MEEKDLKSELWMVRHRRNELGRLVCNAEKHLGLPITTEDSISHMDLGLQIKHLTERLAEIGGEQLRAAKFGFDDSPTWDGFTNGRTWNGWACPWLSFDDCIKVLEWMDYYTWEVTDQPDGTKLITVIDPEYPTEPTTYEPNKIGLYQFGDGWTWDEINEEEVQDADQA